MPKKSSKHSKHIKVLKINNLRFGKRLECLGMFGKCMQFPKHSKHINLQIAVNQRFGCLESLEPKNV